MDYRTPLPRSCTVLPISLVGLAGFVTAVVLLRQAPDIDAVPGAMLALAGLALPIMVLEAWLLRTYRRPSTGLDFSLNRPIHWRRSAVKLLGFYGSLGGVALVYWLFPEYHGNFYEPFWELLRLSLPTLLVGAIPYFIWVDRYMQEPEDGYWLTGRLLLGRYSPTDLGRLRQHALGWVVKGFFLPLMFIYFTRNLHSLRQLDLGLLFTDFNRFYDFSWEILFTVDLVFTCVGYILTMRILDTHIRSVEPTVAGWLAALICYQPFWSLIGGMYLAYNADGVYWGGWLADHPVLYVLWGSAILALTLIYAVSTACFGLRFSNLTHRGIITNGCYRYTKHPAYVSKNLAWWLVAVPFIASHGWADALRDCLLLLGLNLVYFIRARTEERHLSQDPVYVQYALAINERGLFSGLGRRLTYLRYRPA